MMDMLSSFDIIIFVLELIGTIAFAISGVITAVEKDLDLLGVLVLGIITAGGGGALRDILHVNIPPMLFLKPIYAIVAFATSLISFCYLYFRKEIPSNTSEENSKIINLLDAVGLGVFVVVGVRASITAGYGDNFFLAVFIGTVTGVGGGLMRDQLAGLIPMVLRKRIYAIAALAGACIYYLLYQLHVSEYISAPSGIVLIILIRLLASKYRWSLPHIRKKQS